MRGAVVIEAFARSLPLSPGVYRMFNAKGDALYIGKARQLQKRVMSYAQMARLPHRLRRMVAETTSMEAIHTRTEAEALMLEANMIRKHMPRYNVQLRDDKSVPYILVSSDHPFPQLLSHRGPRTRPGSYYGPFASSGPVWNTIAALQRVFQIRNCSDAVFAARKRPCMQYHIKRCTAPCVARVSTEEYGEQVALAKKFLDGKSVEIQQQLAEKMQEASARMDYEVAGNFRDRIRALTAVQQRQDINLEGIIDDVDLVAGYLDAGQACITVFFFRGGRNYGNKAYFPRHDQEMELPEILDAFLGQFYQTRPAAPEILLSHDIPDCDLLSEALTTENNRRVQITTPKRGPKKRIVDQAIDNARRAHARSMADTEKNRQMLEKITELMRLESIPERVEIYDNSHLGGTNALGVMVVVGAEGFQKKHYRKFNIKGEIQAGDDYAMLREVLTRRLSRGINEEKDANSDENTWPDLLIIDGGKGQLSAAQGVLDELNLTIPLMAISKGPDRNAGREWLHFTNAEPVQLPPTDPLLYFLQRARDEAHRFAIGGQRTRRSNAMLKSALDSVPGIGGKRKKALLLHFGSAKAVERAGISDLMKVEGVSKATAEMIYNYFHEVK
ncbi:MAG: uvrC [Alphaproteobacteria bacterium]|nr:uvrC [Alphaproteobacteria bacterium]